MVAAQDLPDEQLEFALGRGESGGAQLEDTP